MLIFRKKICTSKSFQYCFPSTCQDKTTIKQTTIKFSIFYQFFFLLTVVSSSLVSFFVFLCFALAIEFVIFFSYLPAEMFQQIKPFPQFTTYTVVNIIVKTTQTYFKLTKKKALLSFFALKNSSRFSTRWRSCKMQPK